jgi:hypothetical protein
LAERIKRFCSILTNTLKTLVLLFRLWMIFLITMETKNRPAKKTGSDKANNKTTYPCRYGLQESYNKIRELTENAKRSMELYNDDAEFFFKLADELAERIK